MRSTGAERRALLRRCVRPPGTEDEDFDHGKYENHACDPNTLTTGFGFDIAVRDIQPGAGSSFPDHKILLQFLLYYSKNLE